MVEQSDYAQHHLANVRRTGAVCGRTTADEYNPIDATLKAFQDADIHCLECHEIVEKGRTLQ